jgi:hypothetical protein
VLELAPVIDARQAAVDEIDPVCCELGAHRLPDRGPEQRDLEPRRVAPQAPDEAPDLRLDLALDDHQPAIVRGGQNAERVAGRGRVPHFETPLGERLELRRESVRGSDGEQELRHRDLGAAWSRRGC